MRAYVYWFCCVSGLIVAAVAALNYFVDPYLMHQWDSPQVQRLRPPRERLSVWGKTYAIARYRPTVLYLGNSRTEVGLPTNVQVFSGKAVFNGALSGASAGDVTAMAAHAMHASRLDTVVWGLDAPSFSMLIGTRDFDRALVSDGSRYFLRRGLLDVKRALTVDMTRDSLSVLAGTFGSVCHSSLALYGQHDERCLASRIGGWGGSGTVVAARVEEYLRGDGPTPAAFSAVSATLDQLCRDGTRVRLYINPTHAMTQDALFWSGKWPAVERWQQSLVALAAGRRATGCDVRLYDFSGYNSITTEAIPQANGGAEMRYYWEPSHYRGKVGRMIIQRIFGGLDDVAPADFGVELTPAMLQSHLAQHRAQRERYHEKHPLETALGRQLAQAQLNSAH